MIEINGDFHDNSWNFIVIGRDLNQHEDIFMGNSLHLIERATEHGTFPSMILPKLNTEISTVSLPEGQGNHYPLV